MKQFIPLLAVTVVTIGGFWALRQDAPQAAADPQCADFNFDGTVRVGDILYVVGQYFTNDPFADLNPDGDVRVDDILAAVGQYFADCTRPYPTPVSTPFDFGGVTEPVIPGFSSWEQFADFTASLRNGGTGGGVSGGPIAQPIVTLNPDGTLTIVPAIITQPDGSTARWIGPVPYDSVIHFNEDGTISVEPAQPTPEGQP